MAPTRIKKILVQHGIRAFKKKLILIKIMTIQIPVRVTKKIISE